ncbi:MAG TPA: hypothetical protein VK563_23975 [Puia sp.]|nr:hypothetical protein [Puia sp.]
MKTKYLFPYKSRFIGLLLILIHVPVVAIWESKNPGMNYHRLAKVTGPVLFTKEHLIFCTISLLVLVGLFLIAFSKEKIEDEQIGRLRLDSLQWAIYFNYFMLMISIIFTNSIDFTDILQLNLWLPLLFFIIRFRWVIFRLNRSLN